MSLWDEPTEENTKKKKRRRELNLPPALQFALAKGALYVGAGVVPILLLEYSPVLGVWWAILLTAYIGLLITLRVLVLWPRERNALIHDLGEEQFYALFPKEKKKAERRKKREQKKQEKKDARAGFLL